MMQKTMIKAMGAQLPRLQAPPKSLAARAILALKPYMKGDEWLELIAPQMDGLAAIAEATPGFQKAFNDWLEDVKRIAAEAHPV